MTSKCGKNKKVAHEAIAECVTDVICDLYVICDLLLNRRTTTWTTCDLLLNRRTTTWNLFVKFTVDQFRMVPVRNLAGSGQIIPLWTSVHTEQGCRSGNNWRLPPMWAKFDSGPVPYVGWVCCWFSPCSQGSLAVHRFSFLRNNQHSKFQFDQDKGPSWIPAKANVASSLNIVIYLLINNCSGNGNLLALRQKSSASSVSDRLAKF